MIDFVVLALVVGGLLYGGLALKIYSKKIGIDIHQKVQWEIRDRVQDAIHYTEEIARNKLKAANEVMSSIEKAALAVDKACEWLPDVDRAYIEGRVHAALPELRSWFGEYVEDLGKKIKG